MTTATPKTEQLDSRTDAREGRRSFAPRAERGLRVFIRGNPFCLETLARADGSGGARKLSRIRAHASDGVNAPGRRVRHLTRQSWKFHSSRDDTTRVRMCWKRRSL